MMKEGNAMSHWWYVMGKGGVKSHCGGYLMHIISKIL
jgi:hypothetical protein